MTSNFWYNNPNILIEKNELFDIIPYGNYSFEKKLNSISRLVIILSFLGFFITFSTKYLFIGIITLVFIVFIYYIRKRKIINTLKNTTKEGYMNLETNETITNPVTLENVLKKNFYKSNKKNPFGNVLLTEIQDNPGRKSAPPSFNVDVSENITNNIKNAVQYLNPTITDTNKQIYGDLYQNFELDQSNRVFYSNPNTKVVNDQGAFGEFLYGNMPSAKEGDPFALVQDNYRYILI